MSRPVAICCCHSDDPKDLRLLADLEKHLTTLIRTQQITFWHRRKIGPSDKKQIITAHQIATADIILLLLSKHFFSSQYCYDLMSFALIQFYQRQASVIPVYLYAYDYEDTPLNQFKALPSNEKPIADWSNKDRALKDVVQGIRLVIEPWSAFPAKKPRNASQNNLSARVSIPGMRQFSVEELQSESLWQCLPHAGLCIHGKYHIHKSATAQGEKIRTYCSLCIPCFTPVSVTIDTHDYPPKNIGEPSVTNWSSDGLEIFGYAIEANSVCEVAGNISIQY